MNKTSPKIYPKPSMLPVVIEAIQNEGDADRVRRMIKELNEHGGPDKTKQAIEEAKREGFVIDANVRLKHDADSENGKVVGYNENSGGFYPGYRYPIIIKFERGTFEYGAEELELV